MTKRANRHIIQRKAYPVPRGGAVLKVRGALMQKYPRGGIAVPLRRGKRAECRSGALAGRAGWAQGQQLCDCHAGAWSTDEVPRGVLRWPFWA